MAVGAEASILVLIVVDLLKPVVEHLKAAVPSFPTVIKVNQKGQGYSARIANTSRRASLGK
ncbi:hypothetical protein [Rhizobium rhizogenes]|uniref:hypothetical protein n=1 Tax=Rhizobium rhizogenes TaxID=359 RepID=UPI001246A386|nr:hypothetical protein [Rhizobium rhizogenes]